jgi:CHAD domain-containing protein
MKTPAQEAETGAAAELSAEPGGRGAASAGPSAQQLALAELRQHLTDWITHEPGVRRGRDPEELHQLRVAVRRIDATLGVFKHQIPARLVHARKTAKGVLRGLGAARDFDVQLAELRHYCAELPAEERAAAAPLKAWLEEARLAARTRMLGMLDSEATRHWLETLNLASASFAAATDPPAVQAVAVIPQRVRGRFRKLKRAVGRLDARSTLADHHAVRRRAKQLRYAIECGASLFGKPAEDMLKALRRLQNELGAHQDADMSKTRLAELAASGADLPPATLFLMGRIAEHHLTETRQARKSLERAWRKVGGRRWKSLRARMEELSTTALALTSTRAGEPMVGADSPPLPGPKLEDALPSPPGPRALRH